MNKKISNNALKIAIAIIAFIFIAYGYSPQVFEGKVVNQSDISSWQGMANEILTYNNEHPGEKALWTNSMFGGMPATTISVIYEGDYTDPLYKLLFTGARPASYLLISLIGGFLLFLAFGVNIWVACLGAIAFTFCSYNMQIIQVGHNTKMVAIAFMPWVLAAIVYAYRKCAWLGGIFFAFALSFQIKANHPQITYYLAIIIIGYGIWQLCAAVKEKTLPKFIRTSAILLVAGMIGIATNINYLWPTYEYTQHTMRGGSELSPENGTEKAADQAAQPGKKTRKGLDLEYATHWSYGIGETANLLIPNFYGGSSVGALDKDSQTYKTLKQGGYQGAEQVIKQLPLYWGEQPSTVGPMYMGAISIFLFVLGFFVLRGGLRWWIGGVSLLALMLGWGYHFMPASEFFFNWAPMYNKFRTVSMILVILQILIPIMAVLTVNRLLFGEKDKEESPAEKKRVRKGFYWALGLTAGFSLLFALIPSLAGNFISANDGQIPDVLINSLIEDRMGLLRTDAFRTVAFILLGAGVLWFAYNDKIKKQYAVFALIALVLADLWTVDKRYLNDSHFVTRREFKNVFNLRPVDTIILEDKDPDYRVLDLSISTFNDSHVSYHHKTVGGYSAAKIQRYQDLIDRYIQPEIMAISRELGNIESLEQAQEALTYKPVLSMLNTRYIIINGNVPPLVNNYALGNAWFVDEIIPAANANEEIAKLGTIDPARQAIVSREFLNGTPPESLVPGTTPASQDSTASITLTSYAPNRIAYSSGSAVPQTALFSEIYYYPGWKATIDGKEAPIFRANWILRGLQIPAGEHEIVFTFEPESFYKGAVYSRIASGLLIALLLGGLIVIFIKNRKK